MSEAFNVSLLDSVQVMKQSTTSEGEFGQELLQKCIAQHKNIYIRIAFILSRIFYASEEKTKIRKHSSFNIIICWFPPVVGRIGQNAESLKKPKLFVI